MPGLFLCAACRNRAVRPAISTIYSRANTCSERCYYRFREKKAEQYASRKGRPVKQTKNPGKVRVMRPEPVEIPAVPEAVYVDPVDAIFERARAMVAYLEVRSHKPRMEETDDA